MQPTWIHGDYLRRHLKAHNGETNACDFAFFQAGNLRPHLKAHSGEKPKNTTYVTPIKVDDLENQESF